MVTFQVVKYALEAFMGIFFRFGSSLTCWVELVLCIRFDYDRSVPC